MASRARSAAESEAEDDVSGIVAWRLVVVGVLGLGRVVKGTNVKHDDGVGVSITDTIVRTLANEVNWKFALPLRPRILVIIDFVVLFSKVLPHKGM